MKVLRQGVLDLWQAKGALQRCSEGIAREEEEEEEEEEGRSCWAGGSS